ncbi:hypothetical protein CGI63_21945, partial [Vibrio parahaemolyticus]|uniref:hypothetical protein n=1 Tax=Vibrio parahaemolyticus TaxID=670 RepID=UPI00116DC959
EFYKIRKGRVGKVLINFKSKPWVWQLTNCSRGIPNAWRFSVKFGRRVYGAVFKQGRSVGHPLTGR